MYKRRTKYPTTAKSAQIYQLQKLELFQMLNEYQLKAMKEIFEKKENKCLNEEEIQSVLMDLMDIDIEPEGFHNVFKQMNRQENGVVGWDEFISYLILQFTQSQICMEYDSLLPPISKQPTIMKSGHRYFINRVAFFPMFRLDQTVVEGVGNIVTCSREGQITFWSIHMQQQRQVYSTCPALKIQSTWITDMVVLPDFFVICTSSTERDLRFYDTSAKKFILRVYITSLKSAVTTMSYHHYTSQESALVLGDMDGHIFVMYIKTESRGPFRSTPGEPLLQIRFQDVQKNAVPGFRVIGCKTAHTDFVMQVMYFKSTNSVISCSNCTKYAVLINDVTRKETNVLHVNTGAWCFAVEKSAYLIATGGLDCLIRLWNYFITHVPTTVLYGHHRGIIHLTFQDNGKFLYSLSEDKWIRVWNVEQRNCLQTFCGLPTDFGFRTPLTVTYIETKRVWVIGSNMIAVLPLNPQPNPEHTDGQTHTKTITVVLYNKLFEYIVTCGLDSYILVWNPFDGRRMQMIKNAHTRSQLLEPVPVEIICASFGTAELRLLTGAHDGSIKIWNFISGTCLYNFQIDTYNEVRSIVCSKGRFFACGWNKCLTEFSSDFQQGTNTGTSGKIWDVLHTDEISCAVIRYPQAIVTGGYQGQLIFWRLETGQAYMRFEVVDPSVRLRLNYKRGSKRDTTKLDRLKKKISEMESTSQASSNVVVVKDRFGRNGITCMLFLKAREMAPNTGTLLVALRNGFIQIWSHHGAGGFLKSFYAVHKNGDYISTMTTDEKNEFLFTGSLMGYLKTWLLINYCVPDPPYVCMPKYRLEFPFTWRPKFFLRRAANAVRNQPQPILLNSFMGHLQPVTSLVYMDIPKILVSTSADSSARMWSLGGQFIQTIGTFKKWKPLNRTAPCGSNFNFSIPADLTRKMSSTTLRVLSGGIVQQPHVEDSSGVKKVNVHIDKRKIYGKRLEPIFSKYLKTTKHSTTGMDINLDTSFPHIPVYHHFVMPPENDLFEKPQTHDISTVRHVRTQDPNKE